MKDFYPEVFMKAPFSSVHWSSYENMIRLLWKIVIKFNGGLKKQTEKGFRKKYMFVEILSYFTLCYEYSFAWGKKWYTLKIKSAR